MKTIKKISLIVTLFLGLWAAMPSTSSAQMVNNSYFNVDWQFNIPISSDFATTASGWGMNFEGGCYIAPKFALGLFLNYHTNNEYIPRETITLKSGSEVTTDQQHSMFQLPFGVSSRYKFFNNDMFQIYCGLKLGAAYSQMNTYYNIYETSDNCWGFYTSPEVGTTFYPVANQNIGIHFALYYSYASNQGEVFGYQQHSLNNFGFRLGISL